MAFTLEKIRHALFNSNSQLWLIDRLEEASHLIHKGMVVSHNSYHLNNDGQLLNCYEVCDLCQFKEDYKFLKSLRGEK